MDAFKNGHHGVQAVFRSDEETPSWEVVESGSFMGLVKQRNVACKPTSERSLFDWYETAVSRDVGVTVLELSFDRNHDDGIKKYLLNNVNGELQTVAVKLHLLFSGKLSFIFDKLFNARLQLFNFSVLVAQHAALKHFDIMSLAKRSCGK